MPETITNTVVEPEAPKSKPQAPKTQELGEFGDGRYSKVMTELFRDSQRLLCLTEQQADKLARSFGAELGRLASDVQFKWGKVNKDNKCTLREVVTMKGITMTHALSLGRACVILQEATGFGVSSFEVITLDKQYQEWLNK